jgi:hypothetical protein
MPHSKYLVLVEVDESRYVGRPQRFVVSMRDEQDRCRFRFQVRRGDRHDIVEGKASSAMD